MKTKVLTEEYINSKILKHSEQLKKLNKEIDKLNSNKQYHKQRLKHYQSLGTNQIEIIF